MPKKINIGKCSIDGCDNPERSLGFCNNHYSLFKKRGTTDKLVRNKRSHKYYSLWFDRKTNNLLSEEWQDFWQFIEDIGERPEGDYYLVRLDGSRPFGKDNFKWQEHLRRKKGEPIKEWWARKLIVRKNNIPSMDRKRTLRRSHGLSEIKFDEMLEEQNGVCAICFQEENSFDPHTGTRKKLAVDHCHKTGRIRGLLCFRCNGTLGKILDSVDILRSMERYLLKEHVEIELISKTLKKKNYIRTPLGIMDVEEAAEKYNLAVRTINRRILKGLSIEEILAPSRNDSRKSPTPL